MSCPQKIMLENLIFSWAELLRVPVYGKVGRLISSSPDVHLQELLNMYNAFFYEENWKNFCAYENNLEGLCNFQKISARTPLLSGKEYKFELIIGGKDAW